MARHSGNAGGTQYSTPRTPDPVFDETNWQPRRAKQASYYNLLCSLYLLVTSLLVCEPAQTRLDYPPSAHPAPATLTSASWSIKRNPPRSRSASCSTRSLSSAPAYLRISTAVSLSLSPPSSSFKVRQPPPSVEPNCPRALLCHFCRSLHISRDWLLRYTRADSLRCPSPRSVATLPSCAIPRIVRGDPCGPSLIFKRPNLRPALATAQGIVQCPPRHHLRLHSHRGNIASAPQARLSHHPPASASNVCPRPTIALDHFTR